MKARHAAALLLLLAATSGRAQTVLPGDHTVLGALCVGPQCASESFGDDTLRLKAYNLRIHVDDRTTNPDYSGHDWGFLFNDVAQFGEDYFAVEDRTLATVPFRIDGFAPTNALRIAGNGDIGIGTGLPQHDLHIVSNGGTAVIRMGFDQALTERSLDGGPLGRTGLEVETKGPQRPPDRVGECVGLQRTRASAREVDEQRRPDIAIP